MRLSKSPRVVGRRSARLSVCISLAALLLAPLASAQDPALEKAPQLEEEQARSEEMLPAIPLLPYELRERDRAERDARPMPERRQAEGDLDQDRADLIELLSRSTGEIGVRDIQQGLAETMLGGSTRFTVTVISAKSTGLIRITGPEGLDRKLSGDQLQQILTGNTSPLGVQLIGVLGAREINPSVFAQQLLNML